MVRHHIEVIAGRLGQLVMNRRRSLILGPVFLQRDTRGRVLKGIDDVNSRTLCRLHIALIPGERARIFFIWTIHQNSGTIIFAELLAMGPRVRCMRMRAAGKDAVLRTRERDGSLRGSSSQKSKTSEDESLHTGETMITNSPTWLRCSGAPQSRCPRHSQRGDFLPGRLG